MSEEIEIIQYLNDKGCVSCPRLISEGRLPTGERYFIQERIESQRRFNVADLVFALLEQKSFGVCQGDFKRDNLRFGKDGVCYLIDYDQAVYDDKFMTMGNVEFLEAFNRFFVDRWRTHGFDFKDMYSFGGFTREEVMSLFRDDAFNLATTTILKEQSTTLTETGIYHSLHTNKLYIDGTRDLDARRAALETIEFVSGERVLDVGCNMGLLCHYLHDQGCDVTGVDMDPQIVLAAKMTANILNKQIEFAHLDMDSGTIDTDYDTICLFSVIHHVKNFRQATANVAQRCNRIILECSLREVGAKPIQGQWIRTSGWEFGSREELIKFLEEVFTGFKFQQHHGTVDRQREILSLVKTPSMASV